MTIRLRPAKPAWVILALFVFALTVTLAHDSYAQTINPGDILIGNLATGGGYQIIRIDPNSGSQQILTTLPSAWGFCVTDQGFIYTGQYMTPAVQRFDLTTGTLVTVSTGGYLYGTESQPTWDVAQEPTGTLLAASGDRLVRINPRTGSQSLLYQGAEHAGLAIAPNGVIYGVGYWSSSQNERLYMNDPFTGSQTVILDFGTIESGGESTAGAIACDPSTGMLIVGIPKYEGNAAVYRVNPSTGHYTRLGQFPNSQWYLTGVGPLADGTIALSSLGEMSTGQVGKLDTATGATTVLASINDPFIIGGLHIVPPAAPPLVTWTGVAGPSWTTGDSANWRNRFGPGTYTDGQNVVFDDTADTGSVNLPANVSPSSVRVANLVLTYTFSGGAITGAAGLTKDCLGTLILNDANTYGGGTTVSAGMLRVENTTGSGTGTGPVTVGAATLGGPGFIDGPVTLTGDSTLTSTGTLTIYNTLTVQGLANQIAGGTILTTGDVTIDPGAFFIINGTLGGVTGTLHVKGTLMGKGTIGKPLVIESGGVISPGAPSSIGTLSQVLNAEAPRTFSFEIGGPSPNYANPKSSVNDVLRLTNEAMPFANALGDAPASLTAGTVIDVYFLFNDPPQGQYKADFFAGTDFTDAISDATFQYWRLDPRGSRLHNGNFFSPLDPSLVDWSVVPETATFDGAIASGYITEFAVVPDPATLGLLALGGLVALRRRR